MSSTEFYEYKIGENAQPVLRHKKRMKSSSLVDKVVSTMFPSEFSKHSRLYHQLILKCKCGYSPKVCSRPVPVGTNGEYYTCGSKCRHKCDFFLEKKCFEHNYFDTCLCDQPMKLFPPGGEDKKNLVCMNFMTDESCNLIYGEREYEGLAPACANPIYHLKAKKRKISK